MLSFDAQGPSALYSGVEKGGKAKATADGEELRKKAKPIDLTFDVIFDRWTPALVAMGPQFDPKEPPGHVEIVKLVFLGLVETLGAHGIHIQYVCWPTREALQVALEEDIKAAFSKVKNTGEIRGNPLKWSTLAALAGRRHLERQLAPKAPVKVESVAPSVSRETGHQAMSRALSERPPARVVQRPAKRAGRPPVVLSRVR